MRLSASRTVSDNGTLQRIPEPSAESALVGGMIAEILMKRRGDKMLDSSFYYVGGESCAQSLSKALDTTSIISWVAE
jgi:hypothetical protein